ncbi:MAG: hypothetical protein WAV73_06045 [Candidatus Moraniibacteriota bacterium]
MIENSSDELVEYAKESGLFDGTGLADFMRLTETRQVVILTNKIIRHEFNTDETCARPFPGKIEDYYADCFRDCC